jgi:predicted RNA-binding protein with PUA-like domain
MRHWLVKSDFETYSIDHLARDKSTLWDGVRNYQARNFLVEMQQGDLVAFYHSNIEPPAIAGIASVKTKAIADPTQYDSKSDYHDPAATKGNPRWFSPRLGFVEKFKQPVTLLEIKSDQILGGMQVAQRGNRLSVHPITPAQYKRLVEKAG